MRVFLTKMYLQFFSSNHANNYKKLIQNKTATFRLVLIYLLKFPALKNLQKNNSALLLSIHGDLFSFKQSEKSNGNNFSKTKSNSCVYFHFFEDFSLKLNSATLSYSQPATLGQILENQDLQNHQIKFIIANLAQSILKSYKARPKLAGGKEILLHVLLS